MGIKKSVMSLLGLGNKAQGSHNQSASVDEFLSGLGELMGYDVQFEPLQEKGDEGLITYNIKGEEIDSFLGTTTEVLDALSHLSMRIQRRVQGFSNQPIGEDSSFVRIRFDAEGFRDRRRAQLVELAKEIHQKVIDGGKAQYLNALGPAERKVVHTAIAELGQEVVTESIGNGHFKRIRIKLLNGPRHGSRGSGQGPRQGRGQRNDNRDSRGPRNGNRDQPAVAAGAIHDPFTQNGVFSENEPQVDDDIGNRLRPGEESPYFNGNDQ